MHPTTTAHLRALGQAIRNARRKLHLTQAELAELCSLDDTHISRVENGHVNISFENIDRIARALRLKPSYLLDQADL